MALKVCCQGWAWGVFCVEPVPLQFQMLSEPRPGGGVGLARGSLPGPGTMQRNCTIGQRQLFFVSREHSMPEGLWLWGIGFQKAQPARWPASGRGWEGRRGGAHRRSRQQVPPGEHLRFGRWFERGRRPPRAKLGVQWVTPDGVKSKTDKALGV